MLGTTGFEAAPLSAGDAHMPGHARPVVAAVDDEIVAFRLHADGAVDGGVQQIVVGGGT